MPNADGSETEQERDSRKQREDLDKRKSRLKKSASNSDGIAALLAKSIAINSGGTYDDLQRLIEGFETGYADETADPTDTPYGMPRGVRPKITIVKENLPRKTDIIPPKSTGN